MMDTNTGRKPAVLKVAAEQILQAAEARKCWACNCFSSTLATLDTALPKHQQSPDLQQAIDIARTKRQPPEIECRGCDVCFPAIALNALAETIDDDRLATACPADDVTARDGWPPLPGNYTVLGYRQPVAICTLNSDDLWATLVNAHPAEVAIIGTLNTENHGIERLISNIVANPHIRFLILCGLDARRKVGHLPGQSLLALSRNGLDKRARIIGAKGKRPVLRNIDHGMIEHFRKQVEVIDMIGSSVVDELTSAVPQLSRRNPGPASPYETAPTIVPKKGQVPERMISDPNGYFIVYPDHSRELITLEHYSNQGTLTTLIEGTTAAETYFPAIEMRLLSRLDHACYLGRELAKAEHSLLTGQRYIQDSAPEQSGGTKPSCEKCQEQED